jgi:sulfur relay protein TusB/DsrH
MTKVAFLVLKSPTEQDPTHMFERFADRGDSTAILIEDGIYQAVLVRPAEKLSEAAHEVLVSREDLEARGYVPSDLKVGKTAEYSDIVDAIMERTERTVTV